MAQQHNYVSRRTCFAVATAVTINTVTSVPVYTIRTSPTILTWVAGTFVEVCNISSDNNNYTVLIVCHVIINIVVAQSL